MTAKRAKAQKPKREKVRTVEQRLDALERAAMSILSALHPHMIGTEEAERIANLVLHGIDE